MRIYKHYKGKDGKRGSKCNTCTETLKTVSKEQIKEQRGFLKRNLEHQTLLLVTNGHSAESLKFQLT